MQISRAVALACLALTNQVFGSHWNSDTFDISPRDVDVDDFDLFSRELGLDVRSYEGFDDEFDNVFERDEEILQRTADELWEREVELEELGLGLYRRSPEQDAYSQLKAYHSDLQPGKSYAFELTIPLKADQAIPKGSNPPTANEKELNAFTQKLGYSHKILLIGTVTSGKGFKGMGYEQVLRSYYTWDVTVQSVPFKAGTKIGIEYRGPVAQGWDDKKIIEAGKHFNLLPNHHAVERTTETHWMTEVLFVHMY